MERNARIQNVDLGPPLVAAFYFRAKDITVFADPGVDITVVLGWLREVTIITGVVVLGWKARGAFQPILDFVDDIREFMTESREFMKVVQSNHLSHIEKYLAKISGSDPEDEISDPQV